MAVGGVDCVVTFLTDPVAIGIVLGLVIGKLIGIFSAAWFMDRFILATKHDNYTWLDLGGLTMVAGIGFTVSQLVAELSIGVGSPHNEHAKVCVVTAWRSPQCSAAPCCPCAKPNTRSCVCRTWRSTS